MKHPSLLAALGRSNSLGLLLLCSSIASPLLGASGGTHELAFNYRYETAKSPVNTFSNHDLLVNTGALYRAVALMAFDRGVELKEGPSLIAVVSSFCKLATWHHDSERLFVGDTDMTPRLGSVEAATGASAIAVITSVRDALLPLQRKLSLSAPKGAMVDGRDIGTVVFPDADLKIFMTASLEQRALRRLKQLERAGDVGSHSAQDIMKAIASRDSQDSGRDTAPMIKAEDAVVFDTSDMSQAEAIQSLHGLLVSKGLIV